MARMSCTERMIFVAYRDMICSRLMIQLIADDLLIYRKRKIPAVVGNFLSASERSGGDKYRGTVWLCINII